MAGSRQGHLRALHPLAPLLHSPLPSGAGGAGKGVRMEQEGRDTDGAAHLHRPHSQHAVGSTLWAEEGKAKGEMTQRITSPLPPPLPFPPPLRDCPAAPPPIIPHAPPELARRESGSRVHWHWRMDRPGGGRGWSARPSGRSERGAIGERGGDSAVPSLRSASLRRRGAKATGRRVKETDETALTKFWRNWPEETEHPIKSQNEAPQGPLDAPTG